MCSKPASVRHPWVIIELRQMVEQEVRTFLGQAKLANLASADWKHVRDYVQNATAVLNPLCSKSATENWDEQMCSAIWQRDRLRCDELLHEANQRKGQRSGQGHGTLPRGRLADLHLEQLEPDERGAIQGHGRRRR
jgi:hypothetical protein